MLVRQDPIRRKCTPSGLSATQSLFLNAYPGRYKASSEFSRISATLRNCTFGRPLEGSRQSRFWQTLQSCADDLTITAKMMYYRTVHTHAHILYDIKPAMQADGMLTDKGTKKPSRGRNAPSAIAKRQQMEEAQFFGRRFSL